MPTGYTANIKNGISFEAFALNCARAFGACITLRDEPGGGEQIPESFAPSDFYAKQLERAQEKLAWVKGLSPYACEQEADKEWKEREQRRLEMLKEKRDLRRQYENMLDHVRAWEPPTSEHVNLKKFMEEQITESIEFDCDESYYSQPAECQSGEAWRKKYVASLLTEIERAAREDKAEIERAEQRTKWINELRVSLNGR